MRYLPHTPEDVLSMLKEIGVKNIDDLFAPIPTDCRFDHEMNLPEPMNEWELTEHIESLASKTARRPDYQIYIGAGSYDHFIPASIPYLLGRSEFSTAYTPYQPEISQGTLTAIFEYQTFVSRLLGMEVANASLYDGASALAEAVLMAVRIGKKNNKIAMSNLIHPNFRKVVNTYLKPTGIEIIDIPMDENGMTDLSAVSNLEDIAGIFVQSPNFFGIIENLENMKKISSTMGCLMCVCFTEPLTYGMLKPPGFFGADIVCGEGQSFGINQSFGGPGLGMFASQMKFVRNMPGRLIGKTKDINGNDGFVLTLATREQHIRREKATSNICTNSGLNALTASMYMASLGKKGLNELAELNHDKAVYLKNSLMNAGCVIPYKSSFFNEFVVKFPEGTYENLLKHKIVPGIKLDHFFKDLKDYYLVCVTETKKKENLDAFSEIIQKGV